MTSLDSQEKRLISAGSISLWRQVESIRANLTASDLQSAAVIDSKERCIRGTGRMRRRSWRTSYQIDRSSVMVYNDLDTRLNRTISFTDRYVETSCQISNGSDIDFLGSPIVSPLAMVALLAYD